MLELDGGSCGIRTHDHCIKSFTLPDLSGFPWSAHLYTNPVNTGYYRSGDFFTFLQSVPPVCPQIKFTKTDLLAIPSAPKGKRVDYTDPKTPGLELRVTDTGTKTFCFRQRAKSGGNPVRVTIGKFPTLTVDQARAEVAKLRAEFVKGEDPAKIKRDRRAEPTFGDLFNQFMKDRKLADSTRVSYETTVAKHLGKLLPLKISQIDRDRMRGLKIESDAQSNRIRAIVGAVFNWANIEGLIDQDNPAKVIKSRHIASRERFLQPEEVDRFLDAIGKNALGDFYLLCLLTGARKSNVQSMRWKDINWRDAVWMVPTTKNREPHAVPLMPEAIDILKARKGLHPIWVYPGIKGWKTGEVGHLKEPKKSWDRLRQDSGLHDLNMHDLRRTMGSWQSMDGASLTIVGKTLGQKSPEATKVYARLNLEPVREAMDRALGNLRRDQ